MSEQNNSNNNQPANTVDEVQTADAQALEVVSAGAIARDVMPTDLKERIAQQQENRAIMKDYVKEEMVPGHHYFYGGGLGRDTYTPKPGEKPTLTKDGASLICGLFNLIQGPIAQEKIWHEDGGHLTVISTATILNAFGVQVASGTGICTTKEAKYAYRKGERICPTCQQPTIYKDKNANGGWYCWSKKGGCGAKFQEGEKSIEDQQTGRIENPDIADVLNTCIKMADKRARVAAASNLPLVSELFAPEPKGNGGGDDRDEDPAPPPARRPAARQQHQEPTEPAGHASINVQSCMNLVGKLIELGVQQETLETMYLPEGVNTFSELEDSAAAQCLPGLAELLNTKLIEVKERAAEKMAAALAK